MLAGRSQLELDGREADTFAFRKVGHATLHSGDDDVTQGSHVCLATAADYGLTCVADTTGAILPLHASLVICT